MTEPPALLQPYPSGKRFVRPELLLMASTMSVTTPAPPYDAEQVSRMLIESIYCDSPIFTGSTPCQAFSSRGEIWDIADSWGISGEPVVEWCRLNSQPVEPEIDFPVWRARPGLMDSASMIVLDDIIPDVVDTSYDGWVDRVNRAAVTAYGIPNSFWDGPLGRPFGS